MEDGIYSKGFENSMTYYIGTKNYAKLSSLLDQKMRYGYFNFFENILIESIVANDYEVASIIIQKGVKINNNLQEILLKLIADGQSALLDMILENQAVTVSVFCDYEALFMAAVNTGNPSVLESLIFHQNLINQLSSQTMGKASKLALEKGFKESLLVILESAQPILKRMLLRSLLRTCSHPDRFFIVQMCVDHKVTFFGIEKEYLWEMLKTAARIGCEKTTRVILGLPSAVAYAKNNSHLPDCPMKIAQEKGYQSIVLLYENAFK